MKMVCPIGFFLLCGGMNLNFCSHRVPADHDKVNEMVRSGRGVCICFLCHFSLPSLCHLSTHLLRNLYAPVQVRELSAALLNIKHEQGYMEVRQATHRKSLSFFGSVSVCPPQSTQRFTLHTVNDSTNSRVVWWSFFEALVLVTMTVGQVYYLHRFFEVRTMV
jgi:hypothetical protein